MQHSRLKYFDAGSKARLSCCRRRQAEARINDGTSESRTSGESYQSHRLQTETRESAASYSGEGIFKFVSIELVSSRLGPGADIQEKHRTNFSGSRCPTEGAETAKPLACCILHRGIHASHCLGTGPGIKMPADHPIEVWLTWGTNKGDGTKTQTG